MVIFSLILEVHQRNAHNDLLFIWGYAELTAVLSIRFFISLYLFHFSHFQFRLETSHVTPVSSSICQAIMRFLPNSKILLLSTLFPLVIFHPTVG